MKKNTLKFKMPSVNNLSNQIHKQITELVDDGQQIKAAVQGLQKHVNQLTQQVPVVTKTIDDFKGSINHWQKQCDPVIKRIQTLINQLNN